MTDPNKLALVLQVPSPVSTDLVFGANVLESGLYAYAIETAAGNLTPVITYNESNLTGVTTNVSLNSLASLTQTRALAGNQSNTELGTIVSSYFNVAAITGTQSNGVVGSVSGSRNFTKKIKSNGFTPIEEIDTTGDPHYNNVFVLLHADGPNNSTTLTDFSPTPKTLYQRGSGVISTEQSKFGGSSLKAIGNNNHFYLAENQGPVFGTGDFTIEFWYMRTQDGQYNRPITNRNYSNAHNGSFAVNLGQTSISITHVIVGEPGVGASFNFPAFEWTHVAFSRNSGYITILVNGIVLNRDLFNINLTLSPYRTTFGTPTDYNGETCYLDDIRITVGVGRYNNAGFSIPTVPYANSQYSLANDRYSGQVGYYLGFNEIGLDSPITNLGDGGSIVSYDSRSSFYHTQYNAASTALSFNSASGLTPLQSSNNYTIEFWIKILDGGNVYFFGNTTGQFCLGRISGKIVLLKYAVENIITGNTDVTDTNWHHIAVCQDSDSIRLYVDGDFDGSNSPTTFTAFTNPVYLGGVAGSVANVYIDDFRSTNIARYTDAKITLIANNVIDSLALTGVESTTEVNDIGFEKTIGNLFITTQVGNVTASWVRYVEITGNSSDVLLGDIAAISGKFAALTSTESILGQHGSVTSSITDNLLTNLLTIVTPGNVTAVGTFERSIIGNVSTGNVGGTYANNVFQITSVSTTLSLGQIEQYIPVDREAAILGVTTTVSIRPMVAGTLTESAILGNQTNVLLNNVIQTYRLTGNTITTGVSDIIDVHSYGESSVGYVGSVIPSQQLSRGLVNNTANVVQGNLSAFKTDPITGVIATSGTGLIVPVLTGTNLLTVNSTGVVGNLLASTQIFKNLFGNELNAYTKNFIQSFPSGVNGVETVFEVGDVISSLTDNFAEKVTSICSVGNVTIESVQFKNLNSNSFRSLATGSVGNLIAKQTVGIFGVESVGEIGDIITSLTGTNLVSVSTVCAISNIGMQSTGVRTLTGVQSTAFIDDAVPTKIILITGNGLIGRVGTIIPRTSLGVRSVLSVGSIVTSQIRTASVDGVSTDVILNNIRDTKFSQLTGVATNITSDQFALVRSSFSGNRITTQVGSITTSSIASVGLNGNVATGALGAYFVSQTIAITGVYATTTADPFALVRSSFSGSLITSQVGSVKVVKSFGITGNQINSNFTGGLEYRTFYNVGLIGNESIGRIHNNIGPNQVYLYPPHYEVEIPKVYSMKLEGNFSYITSFVCLNSTSKIIETTVQGAKAWIRFYTPGNFDDPKLYYIDKEFVHGITTVRSEVPEGAEIYRVESNKVLQLVFLMTGVFDDTGNKPIPVKRFFYIDIMINHSVDRDEVNSAETL
jgi:hypothetical protein